MRRRRTAYERNRIGQLMRDVGSRPLLREAGHPVAGAVTRPAEDVLKNAAVLIECFLDEKRVVDDLEFLRLRKVRRFFLREA